MREMKRSAPKKGPESWSNVRKCSRKDTVLHTATTAGDGEKKRHRVERGWGKLRSHFLPLKLEYSYVRMAQPQEPAHVSGRHSGKQNKAHAYRDRQVLRTVSHWAVRLDRIWNKWPS